MSRALLTASVCAVLLSTFQVLASDEIQVRVQTNARSLFLTSQSGSDLGDCAVYLNDGYTLQVPRIAASAPTELWLTEFVSKGVLRFDPKLERVRRVHVICRKPSYGDALFRQD